MVRTSRIAERRPNSAVLFLNQVVVRQILESAVAPFTANTLMQELSKRFRQSIRQCLDHNRVVIVVLRFELMRERFRTDTRRQCECTHMVAQSRTERRDVVCQRATWPGV